MTRLSPGSNTFEILSRTRLSQAGWFLHCRGKIQSGNPAYTPYAPETPESGEVLEGSEIYEIASDSGLHYGPAFQLVQRVVIHGDKLISVELKPSVAEPSFLLHPARVDCC
jgi:hypothetical protein